MMKAVAWNIRTRVFWGRGARTCFGREEKCFNYAWQYPFTYGDVNSLYKRYFYVIETGGMRDLQKEVIQQNLRKYTMMYLMVGFQTLSPVHAFMVI
jgi:hypothetical protein